MTKLAQISNISIFLYILTFINARPNPEHPLGRNHQPRHNRDHKKQTNFHHLKHADFKWLDVREIPGITDHITPQKG